MNNYHGKLFHKISIEEYNNMYSCLSAVKKTFPSGSTICHFGDGPKHVGIVCSGTASTIRYEARGSRTILERLGPQDIFGEVLSFQNTIYESIFVVCDTDCEVLFFNYDHILAPCSKVCPCHQQMIQNMLQIISEKAILLGERVEVLSKRSIREKLSCYFLRLSAQNGSSDIIIPFSMVDLADYLSVDRSAMTRELKKMKNEELISMERRRVQLLSINDLISSIS